LAVTATLTPDPDIETEPETEADIDADMVDVELVERVEVVEELVDTLTEVEVVTVTDVWVNSCSYSKYCGTCPAHECIASG